MRKNERYNLGGWVGWGGGTISYKLLNKWATDTKRMAKRKKGKRAEIRKRD